MIAVAQRIVYGLREGLAAIGLWALVALVYSALSIPAIVLVVAGLLTIISAVRG